MTVTSKLKELYAIDDHLWFLKTIEIFKQKQWNELDVENLIEELESLAKKDRNQVKSLLEQIIRYLLLLQFWTAEYERNAHHWEAEIYSFRNQLDDELTTTLRNYLVEEKLNIYQKALGYVQRKTKFTNFKVDFPAECPYTFEQLLELDYLPEISENFH